MTKIDDSRELKPCPFCGSEAVTERTAGIWTKAYCRSSRCAASLLGAGEDQAIALWNARDGHGAAVCAHPDDIAVDQMASVMKAKLAKKREQGRGGWQDKSQCTAEQLSKMLIDHIAKGDPIDVANFAMMLHQRGEWIITQPSDDSRRGDAVLVPREIVEAIVNSDPHGLPLAYHQLYELCKTLDQPSAAEKPEPLTDSYVQTVPDKCDRIVWRKNYYHLPLASTTAAPRGADAELRTLQWTTHKCGDNGISYDHAIAMTRFGRILITWKGWKEDPAPVIYEHPTGFFYAGDDLESTKREAEKNYFEAIDSVISGQGG